MKLGLSLCAWAAALLLAAPALACWDGFTYETGRISIAVPVGEDEDHTWTPALARVVGRRLAIIESLLPKGAKLSGGGPGEAVEAELPKPGGGTRTLVLSNYLQFTIGALRWEIRAGRLPRPRAKPAVPLTVELGVLADLDAANALRATIADRRPREGWAQGYLQSTSEADPLYVEKLPGPHGKAVFRVGVGAYLRRGAAERVRLAIASATGLPAAVKPL